MPQEQEKVELMRQVRQDSSDFPLVTSIRSAVQKGIGVPVCFNKWVEQKSIPVVLGVVLPDMSSSSYFSWNFVAVDGIILPFSAKAGSGKYLKNAWGKPDARITIIRNFHEIPPMYSFQSTFARFIHAKEWIRDPKNGKELLQIAEKKLPSRPIEHMFGSDVTVFDGGH